MSDHPGLPLPGSYSARIAAASYGPPADPAELIQVTLRLRRKNTPSLRKLALHPVARRKHLTSEQFDAKFGAHPTALREVDRFAAATGLTVERVLSAASLCVLKGSVAQVCRAFGITLHQCQQSGQRFRGRLGLITLPAYLQPWVLGVYGLDTQPQCAPRAQPQFTGATAPIRGARDLVRVYDFPLDSDGAGQTVALLHFDHGYLPEDVPLNFPDASQRPDVLHREVLGAQNNPLRSRFEPTLDMVVVGEAAPGVRIVHYFTPDTTAGWIHAFAEMIHDREFRPSVISVSWGSVEAEGDSHFYAAVNDQLRSAALLGITLCCATGDNGGLANEATPSVNFPASSPYVLAVGGSSLRTSSDGTVEVVWNEGPHLRSAGGVSRLFSRPAWQKGHRVTAATRLPGSPRLRGRALPDVCAHAGGQSFFVTPLPGQQITEPLEAAEGGGTSAAAPLWAALIARLNGALGRRVGWLTPLLYQNAATPALRDIQHGDNGTFFAQNGWDACTGLGSPNGKRLLRLMRTGTASSRKRARTPLRARRRP